MYKNNHQKAVNYLRSHGCLKAYRIEPDDLEKLNQAAAIVMDAYKPKKGDIPIVGWVFFTDMQNADGSPHEYRDADGFCHILGGKAVIGLSQYTLKQSLEYAVIVGAHELAHTRFEDHDDNFARYHMTICHDILKKNRIERLRHFFRLGG